MLKERDENAATFHGRVDFGDQRVVFNQDRVCHFSIFTTGS